MPQIVNTPTGVIIINDDGTVTAQGPRSILPQPTPTGGQQTPKEAEVGSMLGRQADILGSGLEAAASFIPGVKPAATGLRVGAPMVIGAINDLLQGRNPLQGAAFNGIMGGGAELMSRVIPKVTTTAALASGGALNLPKGLGKTIDAFNTEASKSTFPVLAGREEKFKTYKIPEGIPIFGGKEFSPIEAVLPSSRGAKVKTGKTLAVAENISSANGHQLPARDMAVPEPDYDVRLPESIREGFDKFNSDTVREQTIKKTLKQRFPSAPPAMLRRMWDEGLPEAFDGISPEDLKKPGIRNMAILDWQKGLLDQSSLGVREAGQVQRSISADIKKLYEDRAQGTNISTASHQDKQLSEQLVNQMRDWRHGPADIQGNPQTTMQKFRERDPLPGQDGAITAADEKYARLSLMNQANRKMRGQGAIMRGGILATRGALGHTVGTAFGLDPLLSSALGAILLAPQPLSAGGFYAGKGAKYAPGAYRANETKKKVQRREP